MQVLVLKTYLGRVIRDIERKCPEPDQSLDQLLEISARIHVNKRRRGRTAKSLWRWMKRRAAIEPGIGHLKREHRMDRNRLQGKDGDCFNAILSAAGMNFAKLLRWLDEFLRLIYAWLFNYQRTSMATCLD